MDDESIGREIDQIRALVTRLRSAVTGSSRETVEEVSDTVDRLEARLGRGLRGRRPRYTTVRALTGGVVFTERANGSWQIDAKDYPRLERTIGRRMLVHFAQLFIWADRVESITHLLYVNDVVVRGRAIPHMRNLHFLMWSTVGALYEASEALRLLRGAGIEALIPNSSTWKELDALRVRWRSREPFKSLRNTGAFHAETGPISRAMDHFCRRDRRRLLAQSESSKAVDASLALGTELLLAGMGASRHRLRLTIEQLFQDHKTFSDRVRQLFVEVLQAKGLMMSS